MSLTILSVLLLASCATPEPETVVRTEFVEADIPIQPRPRGVELSDVEWKVVNHENLEEFLEDIKVGDEYVFVAITVRDYEKLSLNVAELRRYIEQQQQLIIYYERNLQ